MKRYFTRNNIEVLIFCIVLLIVWQGIAININNDIYLPKIEQVLSSLREILNQNNFYLNIGMTILRTSVSFAISMIMAIVLGVLAYLSKTFSNLLKPINTIIQSVPTMILVVLILIWFDKDKAPFLIGVFIVFPILYETVFGALKNIDKSIVEMIYIYDINLVEKIKNIYIPIININLFPILVSTYSLAFKVIIAGEIYGQPMYGVGSVIQIEKTNFNTSAIFAWIVVILVISILLSNLQKYIMKRNYKWRRQ
ncbi:ABC transporter permease [Paraclostridium sordellii]|uniref:ABC transporter permease n=1 Tax=Paraclostridium sordellii TaxID=1505 RepID=UPI0005E5AC4B|nr:ABC transporter permease subunit [Paeniclostridium sordellii]MCQ4699049.1 ABC transporter permease subunit [Paeniclostridium sordellii]MDU4415194.1 ABC transporter permease subunit [Paeniclostridium sordellii]MDU6481905.1 ABC transporter permease subunit [Paeniclostridium sordellii]MRZ28275.1 ABC transporter permease subunit [Paeniclostridium sordellii]MVO74683.1 ABC transporter permease subunit [Paeniclostridium sordellii]